MKTSELIGPALDWAVAKCEGFPTVWISHDKEQVLVARTKKRNTTHFWWAPSLNWHQAGPIIEREQLKIECTSAANSAWSANTYGWGTLYRGHTPLLAAMRCYVASKLGAEVEIPEELK